ncbi:RJL family GTPase [Fimicolochytrium jonesii]|uniref:RJL family GTPase n=1 Tax=Fimicolochytrium jonesii TaxID=1396493 RepID=UPI0022FDCE6E|nr:RJL family GTPase [Fimicolochytrium jonesii]KAI8820109.1 RJL family GTPase [Fimicolochytrium jonesii]
MDRQPGHLSSPVKTKSDARRIKILSMGDAGVGKSCLIKRYCEGRFIPEYVSTIGIDYGVKAITKSKEEVKVNFWDIGGAPFYHDIRTEFYKDTDGVLVVFSVTDASSFDAIPRWMEELKTYGNAQGVTGVLVGNKCDGDEGERVVEVNRAREVAKGLGLTYFETSAMAGHAVQEMFDYLFDCVLGKLKSTAASSA